MIRKSLSLIVIVSVFLAAHPQSAPAYTLQYRDSSGILARRWLTNPILISFSSSLAAPPANIKVGSDVIATARHALRHWSDACNIRFVELTSPAQTISPQNSGDAINLITVSTESASVFGSSENPALTRVFYDASGAIIEADIALNPHELFSTDGTPGTYDLESTLTHEIGHLIGLDHSAVIAATMQPRQAKNGMYGLPAFTQRTLSDDDKIAARSLYGPRNGAASISGKLITGSGGRAETIFGAHVFAEEVATGRVVAGSVTLANGDYHLEDLPPGEYRLIAQSLNGPVAARDISQGGSYLGLTDTTPAFRSFVALGPNLAEVMAVKPNSGLDLPFFVFSTPPALKPAVIGMNDELSTAPLPLEAGKTFTIYIGGPGIDTVTFNDISFSSSLFTVNSGTLRDEVFDVPYPVISVEIKLARNIQPGDYTIRLRSANGELAYLTGAITVEPPSNR